MARRRGRVAETLAALWLLAKGYHLLGLNLRTAQGEIDILARKGRTLAVVEVKWRLDPEAALNALGPVQRARLLAAGRAVLAARPSLAGHSPRLDMITLSPGRFPRHLRGLIVEEA